MTGVLGSTKDVQVYKESLLAEDPDVEVSDDKFLQSIAHKKLRWGTVNPNIDDSKFQIDIDHIRVPGPDDKYTQLRPVHQPQVDELIQVCEMHRAFNPNVQWTVCNNSHLYVIRSYGIGLTALTKSPLLWWTRSR